MSRAERIAERIWQRYETYFAADGDDVPTSLVCEWFQCGDFDDLLGPEVTAGVLEGFPEAIRQAWWRAFEELQCAREATHSPTCVDIHVANAMKHRRLAKWLQQLERSAQRG